MSVCLLRDVPCPLPFATWLFLFVSPRPGVFFALLFSLIATNFCIPFCLLYTNTMKDVREVPVIHGAPGARSRWFPAIWRLSSFPAEENAP